MQSPNSATGFTRSDYFPAGYDSSNNTFELKLLWVADNRRRGKDTGERIYYPTPKTSNSMLN